MKKKSEIILPTKLEDQIDVPIKKSVAMLNLLGIRTLWACCGFDYKGQPKYKDHVYGNPHIIIDFEDGLRMKDNGLLAIAINSGWQLAVSQASCTIVFVLTARKMYEGIWKDPKSIHYHENANIAIKNLENALRKCTPYFKDEVILIDENSVMQKHFEHWGHEPSDNWVIKKEDYI